ncbi:MAG: hypothetical protein JHC95_20805, partial [Solirubrobacteraceae bacterium]|nr:hypothetical protein [Solirubrobacteraceae bacterium]
MSRSRLISTSVAAMVLAATAPAAHSASAPTSEVRIALASPAKGSAKPVFAGATLTVGAPAQASRSTLTFSGAAASVGATSTASLAGSLTLKAGRRTVTLKALRLSASAKATSLSGTIGRTRLTFLKSKVGAAGTAGAASLTLKRGALKLTSSGAKAIGGKLGKPLSSGATLGLVSGTLRAGTAASGAAGTTTPTPAPVPSTPGPTAPT